MRKLTNHIIRINIFVVFLTFVYFSINLPQNWLGLMDGYFYGLNIKNFLHGNLFTSIDGASALNYPPYFFYIVSLISYLFNITDLGYIQYFSFAFCYCIVLYIVYYSANKVFSSSAGIVAVILFCLSWSSYLSIHLYTKAHALFAMSIVPLLMLITSNLANPFYTRSVLRSLIFVGLLAGVYLPFFIAPFLGFAIVLCFLVRTQLITMHKSIKILFLASLLSLPFIIFLIYSKLFNDGIGVVVFFTPDNYELSFLDLRIDNFFYYIGLMSIILPIISFRFDKKTYYPILFLTLVSYISYGIYFTFFFLYHYGIYTTAPFKYLLVVQFCGMFLFAYLIHFIFGNRLFALSLYILPIATFYLLYQFFHSKIYKDSTDLSTARSNNIHNVVNLINNSDYCGGNYISTGEYKFLDYYLKCDSRNYLIYNESYASTKTKLNQRFFDISDAMRSGSTKFLEYLLNNRIRYIVYTKADPNLEIFVNYPPVMGLRKVTELNEVMLNELQFSGKLHKTEIDPTTIIYEVR